MILPKPGRNASLGVMRNLPRRFLLTAAATSLTARMARAGGAKQTPPVKPVIGAVLPLSGSHALAGDECWRGIDLAAAAVNATGGIMGAPVALTQADATDQNNTAAAVNGLITAQHADVLLGTGASALCYPGSAAAELAQTPYIELNASAAGITARGFKFLLRTAPTSAMLAQVAVQTLLTRYKGAKIGLLFNTGAACGAIAGGVLAALNAAKATPVLVIGYPQDVMDLYDPVGRLMRAGVQIVLHAAGGEDALAFFAAMAAQGWRPANILGCGEGYLLTETAAALGQAFDGTQVVGAPFYPASAEAIGGAYAARYGMAPRSPDSLSAYVGAKLVFETLNASGGDPVKLMAALRATNVAPGGLENGWGVAFDGTGQNTRSFVTLQHWRGGQLSTV